MTPAQVIVLALLHLIAGTVLGGGLGYGLCFLGVLVVALPLGRGGVPRVAMMKCSVAFLGLPPVPLFLHHVNSFS